MPLVWILASTAMYFFTGKQEFLGISGVIAMVWFAKMMLDAGQVNGPAAAPEKKCPPHVWRTNASNMLVCTECKKAPQQE